MCSETEAELATDSACEAAQAWVPVRLVKQAVAQGRLPVVVLLHATGTDKDSLATQQAHFARRGYLAAAIDCRCVMPGWLASPAAPAGLCLLEAHACTGRTLGVASIFRSCSYAIICA